MSEPSPLAAASRVGSSQGWTAGASCAWAEARPSSARPSSPAAGAQNVVLRKTVTSSSPALVDHSCWRSYFDLLGAKAIERHPGHHYDTIAQADRLANRACGLHSDYTWSQAIEGAFRPGRSAGGGRGDLLRSAG